MSSRIELKTWGFPMFLTVDNNYFHFVVDDDRSMIYVKQTVLTYIRAMDYSPCF